MRVPISAKLILLSFTLLITVATLIAIQSSNFFEETSKQREESINLDYAAAKSTEVENLLSSIVDKTQVAASLLMKSETETPSQDFQINFSKENDFLALEIYSSQNGAMRTLKSQAKEEEFQKEKVDASYLQALKQKMTFPFKTVMQGQIEILNWSQAGKPALLAIGIPLMKDDYGRITHMALGFFRLSVIQKPFAEKKERSFTLLDRRGQVLADSDESKALRQTDESNSEIYKLSSSSKTPRGQKLIRFQGNHYFGAFSKTRFGVTAYSLISEEIILEPAREVRRKAFFMAGLVLSGSILFIFLFSMSLTSPIETLAELIGFVSKGNFDVKASDRIRSVFQDEVKDLAFAFDNMTEGLKERDKVKNLFSKFHGSTITEDLMNQDIGLGGQKKEVVVFFSDIRGFTAYSERRAPEEVVEMLNEYFEVMVGIINKNHGVVDKFIGDAIMAVWGAPQSTEKDAHHAVMACLQMRMALVELNEKRRARDQNPLQIGIGLHAGSVISGTIGSTERMEYTVIGNTVNTGSRIEASTKAFGADLLISEEVVARIGDEFLVELAGAAEVKGRSEPLKMYKVRGYKENGSYVEVRTEYSDYEAEHADKVKVAS
ncbi:MAG: adenylate/guanylate cyclase domain-containing protein [Bdellovibrionales bacterium]